MGSGCHLQRHAKMPALSAWALAGVAEPSCSRGRVHTEIKGSELVPGRQFAFILLGPGTGLPSHRADYNELRLARSAPPGVAGRFGKTMGTAPAESSLVEARPVRTRA